MKHMFFWTTIYSRTNDNWLIMSGNNIESRGAYICDTTLGHHHWLNVGPLFQISVDPTFSSNPFSMDTMTLNQRLTNVIVLAGNEVPPSSFFLLGEAGRTWLEK